MPETSQFSSCRLHFSLFVFYSCLDVAGIAMIVVLTTTTHKLTEDNITNVRIVNSLSEQ